MTINHRVLYAIDHQRPGRDRWLEPRTMTASVRSCGDDAAAELAERFELTTAMAARHGCRVRVRVWPVPPDVLTHDADTEPATGSWIYTPATAVRTEVNR